MCSHVLEIFDTDNDMEIVQSVEFEEVSFIDGDSCLEWLLQRFWRAR